MTESMSPFALTQMQTKYAHDLPGRKETWPEIAHRVAKNVFSAVNAPQSLVDKVEKAIRDRKFMPGGRYLYASGREFHNTQNCLLLRAEDSREGWGELQYKAGMALMTGCGIGVDYSPVREEGSDIKKTGGRASGPLSLANIVNEAGRHYRQGGHRRSAIWAGLNWKHKDIFKFISAKNWSPEVKALKEKDFNFPAQLDGTNISVLLDDEFFVAYHDNRHKDHSHARAVYWSVIHQMLETGEPGFSVDVGENAGETLRNAPVCAETKVLTRQGYKTVGEIVNKSVSVWTGKRWATDVVFQKTGDNVPVVKVSFTGGRSIRCDPTHEFLIANDHDFAGQVKKPAKALKVGEKLLVQLPDRVASEGLDSEGYTMGFIYGDGTFSASSTADVTLCTEEKKNVLRNFHEDWISSVTEKDGRGYTRIYFKSNPIFTHRAHSTFPAEVHGWNVDKRASFVAGLFDADGNVDKNQNRVRLSSNHPEFLRETARVLESLGILAGVSKNGNSTYGQKQTYQLVVMGSYVTRFAGTIPCQRLPLSDLNGYVPYRESAIRVETVVSDGTADVFCADVKVPEHSFMAEGVIISNCTEITSRDDSDICNLGSINLARVESLAEFEELVEIGTAFLLAGTVYSDLPYAKVGETRSKNRRLGLGLMGIHEWFLVRGYKYEQNPELAEYLNKYETMSRTAANTYAAEWNLSKPVKTRAIAPNGTIGIVAETTTGIEPLFCAAYKRRYKVGDETHYQLVVDPAAKRLVSMGANPDTIEDAYTLAEDVERRVKFQAWVQQYVDHGISSTINLPAWGSKFNNENTVEGFGNMLIGYLPKLRGITTYPDGSRGGQPLTPVSFREALQAEGQVFVEQADICDISGKGSCGA